MLQFIVCAGIAYGIAWFLNAKWPRLWMAVLSGVLALAIGISLGMAVVIGGLTLFGVGIEHGSIPRAIGQAFWSSAFGAAGGIYQGRAKARGEIPATGTPTRAIFGWGIVSMVAFVAVFGVLWSMLIDNKQAPAQSDRTNPPSEIDRFLDATPAAAQAPTTTQPEPWKNDPVIAPAPVEATSPPMVNWSDFTPVPSEVHPAQQPERTAAQRHLDAIYAAHPDADALIASPSMRQWIAQHPSYQYIVREGTTAQVIEMFDAYKNWVASGHLRR